MSGPSSQSIMTLNANILSTSDVCAVNTPEASIANNSPTAGPDTAYQRELAPAVLMVTAFAKTYRVGEAEDKVGKENEFRSDLIEGKPLREVYERLGIP